MKIFEKIYDDIDKDCGDFTKKTTKNSNINSMYDFVGDLNKIYMAMNRASEYLTITTTFNENSSELIKIIVDSINKE